MTVTPAEREASIERWNAERDARERALRAEIVERNLAMVGRREGAGNTRLEEQDLVPDGGNGLMWCALFVQHSMTRAMEKSLGYASHQPGEQAGGRPRVNLQNLGGGGSGLMDNASMGKWRMHAQDAGAFIPHRRGERLAMEPGDVLLLTRNGADPRQGNGHVTTFLRMEERNGVMGYLCVGGNVRNGVNFEWIAENSPRLIGRVDTGQMLEHAENQWLRQNPGQVAQYAASRSFGEQPQRLAASGEPQPTAMGRAGAGPTRPVLVDDNPRLLGVPASWVQGKPPEDVARIKAAYEEVRNDLTYELGAGPLHLPVDALQGVNMQALRSVVYDEGNRAAPSQTVAINLPEIRIDSQPAADAPSAPYVPPARTLVATADGGFAAPSNARR